MIIKPRIRGFMCTTAHPEGCRGNVQQQIDYVRTQPAFTKAPQRALIIGASAGYGLASRISLAFGGGAATAGIFFEKPGDERRTGSAGWYNAAALARELDTAGLPHCQFNGDAFSADFKQQVITELRNRGLLPLDLVIYSLAAPRRQHPVTGQLHQSVLKPVGKSVTSRTINTDKATVEDISLEPANDAEIADTIAVMGGEDWQLWIDALQREGGLNRGCKTLAYTYIGEQITWPIYGHATIGAAKADLDRASRELRALLRECDGDARVVALKAVVTQASSAIPIMPLYLSLLFRVMKERGVHEGCIEQTDGLMRQLYAADSPVVDAEGRYRRDGVELNSAVQKEVEALWDQVTTENLQQMTDFAGYRREFLQLFGFEVEGVDYQAEQDSEIQIPGLVTLT